MSKSRSTFVVAGALSVSAGLAALPSVVHADGPSPGDEHKLVVVAREDKLHFTMLDEGDTATDPDDEFRLAKDGTAIHEDTVSIHFDAPNDAHDGRVTIVEEASPDGAATTMAWVLTDKQTGVHRTVVYSAEQRWFAWSDGTATDLYVIADDGSVTVNGEPFDTFVQHPPGPLYVGAGPVVIAAWIGLNEAHFSALDRSAPAPTAAEVATAVGAATTKAETPSTVAGPDRVGAILLNASHVIASSPPVPGFSSSYSPPAAYAVVDTTRLWNLWNFKY